MHFFLRDIQSRFVYIALRVVSMMLHCWPIDWSLAAARQIGNIGYRFDAKHRKRALHNLRRSFPGAPEKQLQRVARQSVGHFVMLVVEVLFTARLVRIDTFTRYVQLGDFRETLGLLMKRHQGMIMLTGHYGNWEILGYVLATLGFPTVAVARKLDNPYLNEYILGVRERKGQKIVDKRGATSEITAVLEADGTVGFVADQNAGPKGLFVDFFGRKASTYKSIGLLAMHYNVPVVIGYARRIGDRFRFQIGTEDVIYPADWQAQENPLHYITQRYTAAIEATVRDEPGQYLWIHRRWKSRPKGETPEAYD